MEFGDSMQNELNRLVVREDELDWEIWQDEDIKQACPVYWKTLTDGKNTGAGDVVTGIFVVPVQGTFLTHFHPQQEIYYVLSGRGRLTIDSELREIRAGATVLIPGNARHCLENIGDDELKVFYIFSASSLAEVDYHFVDFE